MASIAANPKRFPGQSVGHGHCVAFARAAALLPHTSRWSRGEWVPDATLVIGTAIATFDPAGRYYVGPPELRANLIPDLNTSTWELTVEQNEARNRGESLFLVCRYRGTTDVETLKIPFDLDRCGIAREKAMLRIGCTSSSPKSEAKS